MNQVLALIPAYNEAEQITQVVERVRAHLPLCVIDDGSSDDTAQLAENAGATVVRQVPNQGKGAALRAGFRYALDHGYDAVVTLDADGQHDPDEIPVFLRAYETTHADLIVGARTFSKMPFTRRLANTLGQRAFSWAMGQPIRDNQSGYRMLSRRLMAVTLSSSEEGFEFEVEMIVTCVEHGFSLEWVPVRTIYAGESSHVRPVRHTSQFMRVVWQTRKRMRSRKR